ncbi:MAG: hypothetical protein Ct9H300mP1_21450 [Planctomycetaceae bacterium]|nr:MAG: hypothetical protein Ct9H300mP1_21450 [Planctomycetaceae bacterium]
MQTSVPIPTWPVNPKTHPRDVRPRRDSPGLVRPQLPVCSPTLRRGVGFIQLMHAGWDQHGNLPTQLAVSAGNRPAPRGTGQGPKTAWPAGRDLVIWGGEFGRTSFCQGDINNKKQHGRDHHPRNFCLWMAGGDPGGTTYGSRTTSATTSPRTLPRPRPPGNGVSLPGYRPRTTDLQVPGTTVPPHRCSRAVVKEILS